MIASPLLSRVRVALMALRHARSAPGTLELCSDVLREVERELVCREAAPPIPCGREPASAIVRHAP